MLISQYALKSQVHLKTRIYGNSTFDTHTVLVNYPARLAILEAQFTCSV